MLAQDEAEEGVQRLLDSDVPHLTSYLVFVWCVAGNHASHGMTTHLRTFSNWHFGFGLLVSELPTQ